MSLKGLKEWQMALEDIGIKNVDALVKELNKDKDRAAQPSHTLIPNAEVIMERKSLVSRPTADAAFKTGKLDVKTWEKIFKKLDLKRETFFSDAEWNKWDRKTLWKNLWSLAKDGDDLFGMVLPQPIQDSGCVDMFITNGYQTNGYQKTLISGTSVLLELSADWSAYLILLEQDPVGNIALVSPSCVSATPKLTGDVRRLPQHPDLKFFKPTTLGENWLWAGIFAELPDWEWLANVPDNGLLMLESEQLKDLWEYADEKPEGSQIWRSSYVVVDR